MLFGDRYMLFLLIQYVAVAILFLYQGAWPKALYWTGAAIITTAVLWMK